MLAALLLGLGSIAPARELAEPGGRRPGLLPVELPRCWPATRQPSFWESWGWSSSSAPARADDALVAAAAKSPGRRACEVDRPRPSLTDLAILAFVASLAFMALEMVAGRLVQRHLGSSIYGWTSVIGVLLAGLSFGNFLGGKIADFVQNEKQASWLFLAASVLTSTILLRKPSRNGLPSMFLGGERQGRALEPGDHAVEAQTGQLLDPDDAGRTGSCSSSRSSSFCPPCRWGRSAPSWPSWRSTG